MEVAITIRGEAGVLVNLKLRAVHASGNIGLAILIGDAFAGIEDAPVAAVVDHEDAEIHRD